MFDACICCNIFLPLPLVALMSEVKTSGFLFVKLVSWRLFGVCVHLTKLLIIFNYRLSLIYVFSKTSYKCFKVDDKWEMFRFLSGRKNRTNTRTNGTSNIKPTKIITNKNLIQCRVILLDGTDLSVELSVSKTCFIILSAWALSRYTACHK